MKEFRLSTKAERIAGISFSAVAIVAFCVLLYALRSQLWLMILCGLFVLLISALLVLYVVNVLKSVCIVDVENKTIEVRGIANFTADISTAVLLQTIGKKNSQANTRVIVFTNEEKEIVAKIPTMFTFKQGIQAEPMAKEMAKELGIDFQENVPMWQYDKEAFKQYQKEEAAREKREAKERQKARAARLFKKYKK